MTRKELINKVAIKYGIPYERAKQLVDERCNKQATALDRVRQQQFNSKINHYSNAMQFA